MIASEESLKWKVRVLGGWQVVRAVDLDDQVEACRRVFASDTRWTGAGPAAGGLVFYRVLELPVGSDPVRYRHLAADPKPKASPPAPPGVRSHPPSLQRPPAAQPWRAADLGLVRSDENP